MSEPRDTGDSAAVDNPAKFAVIVRCECGHDGICWPDRSYPLVPKIVHHDDGSHTFDWPKR